MVVHISILKVKSAKNSDTTLKFNDIQYHFVSLKVLIYVN